MTEQRSYLARYLRMVSLQMMEAGAEICAEVDPILKPTWLSIISDLGRGEPGETARTTVMDAARDMNVSHVHVQNILKAMKDAGVLVASGDPNDGRRTFYKLSKKGRDLVPKVKQVREAMRLSVGDVQKETGVDLFAALSSFKEALDETDWKTRVSGRMDSFRETQA